MTQTYKPTPIFPVGALVTSFDGEFDEDHEDSGGLLRYAEKGAVGTITGEPDVSGDEPIYDVTFQPSGVWVRILQSELLDPSRYAVDRMDIRPEDLNEYCIYCELPRGEHGRQIHPFVSDIFTAPEIGEMLRAPIVSEDIHRELADMIGGTSRDRRYRNTIRMAPLIADVMGRMWALRKEVPVVLAATFIDDTYGPRLVWHISDEVEATKFYAAREISEQGAQPATVEAQP